MGGTEKDSEDMEGVGGRNKDVEVGMCLASLKERPGLIF